MFQHLIATKQLSVYLVLLSLVISAAMMRPGFVTLIIAIPINVILLFTLRWVAHQEAYHF